MREIKFRGKSKSGQWLFGSLLKTNGRNGGKDVDNIVSALEECIFALEYAAFNIDGSKDKDVPSDIIESLSPSWTAILAARRAKEVIKKFK